MYPILAYIKFLFSATNQHGVHSPCIYKLVTQCLYNTSTYDAYKKLNHYRKKLHHTKTTLNIIDLGEGSKTLDANQRQVCKMAKTSSSSKKETQILYRVSKYFHFKNGLELGTSLGMGTYALSLANPKAKITTIEGCPNTSAFAASQLKQLDINSIEFVVGSFKDHIPNLKADTYDLIYFDGHHNKEATIAYFEALLPKAHNDTVFIFDDMYWSKGMTQAWEYIKNHTSVTVTVDAFHLGFVFFRKEQAKEHFKIRL